MPDTRNLKILSISQYGGGLLSTSALSGAIDRQKDYATYVQKYVVLVPGNDSTVEHGDSLSIHGVASSNAFLFLLGAYRKAIQLHREHNFDVVMVDNPHVVGILGIVLKYRLGVRLCVHAMADMIHNPWYKRERFSNRIKHMFMLFSVWGADVVRVSTQAEVERLTAKGINKEKLHLLPFYIDQEAFKKKLALSSERREQKRILFVGRLSYQKDIGTLIRAMSVVGKQHPDARLVLVGDGAQRAEYETLAKSLGVHSQISFLGSVPYDSVAREFKKASLFALSSLYEGTCMVLHEAAAAKLAIVSTAHAGAKDFVRDGIEGRLAPVRDHEALGRAISDMLLDPQKLEKMGEASYARLALFTREAALLRWQNLLEKLAK